MADAASGRPAPRFLRRVLEVLPGLAVWAAITAPVWAALAAPLWLGFFLVLFSAYWFWKSVQFAAGVVVGFWQLHQAQGRDWEAAASALPGYTRLRHLVIVPTYGESEEILADTLHYLATQEAPLERVSVVLAFEGRDPNAPARAAHLAARFSALFEHFLVTFHPDVPGEARGKSSNLAWAGRQVAEELIATGRLDPRHLLVTVCDADSRLHRKYLAALGYAALSHPDGPLHLFQPAILFYANHWRLPAPLRALNSIYSLYELSRMVPSHRLVTQSTYSLSWAAASEVGFWDPDVIPEDSHMFFKLFFHFGRRVKVRPIFLPVYADAAEGPTLWRTLVNHYQQIQRWAWGVSDVPYIVVSAFRARHLPWYLRLARVAWYLEEHLVWPSHWFILTLGGLLPPLLNPSYASSAPAVWQAGLISALMALCLPCLVVVLLADWRLRPQHPNGEDVVDTLLGWAAYALLPLVSLPLSSIPALDAHTRLLLGRYLEYRATEKIPAKARFREQGPSSRAARRFAFEQSQQHRPYALGSTTAMTDSVLMVFRDLR
jgi:cellulose synthase/poly-beta-1,6-N-acetylglucosamine synthase-like glycosyltransferase